MGKFIIYHLSFIIYHFLWVAFMAVGLSLMLGFFQGAFAQSGVSGSAQLTHRSSKTKTEAEEEGSWQLTQFYNLEASKVLTPKVDFTAGLNVNVTETNEEKSTRVAPDLGLDMTNEYFDANAGYRITERGLDVLTMAADEDRQTTESWNANLSTKTTKYPGMRLRYNEDKNFDYLTITQTDRKTSSFSGGTDYSYHFLNFNYEYRNNTTDDYVTESTQDTDGQEARVSFRKSLLENKVTSSGSYSINNTKTLYLFFW